MTDSLPKEIEQGWKLLNEGKDRKALSLIAEFKKKLALSPEEKLRLQILRVHIHNSLGHLEEASKIAEETYKEYEKLGNDFLLIDAINLKLLCLINQRQMASNVTLNLIKRGEIIIKSISIRSQTEIAIKEARFLHLKSIIYQDLGDNNLAMDCNKRSLKLIDQFSIDRLEDQNLRRKVLGCRGSIHINRGELDLALEYYEKSLALKIRDTKMEKFTDNDIFRGMGFLFYSKGDLDNSIKYFKQSLAILEDLDFLFKYVSDSSRTLEGLIRVLIAKGDYESTQHYLNLFKQIIDENRIERNVSLYNLLRAKSLKSSTRSRDRTEAENIFKDIIEKEKWTYVINNALIGLCNLFLEEMKLTNDFTIIDEINPFILQLQEEAKRQNSHIILSIVKLLQARIALIHMNMGDARRFLTQAQQIADEKGYHHLAQIISIEHDTLLGQLGIWENLKKTKQPISERFDLASLEETIENILEKRAVKPPELIEEVPILLLIIAEGGIPAFSYSFSKDLTFEDDMISNLLSAFNSFFEELFSKGLDRAKFGEYLLVMDSVGTFSACYLFKGQSYPAKQKLIKFAHRLQNTKSIWEVLEDFHKTHQTITLTENPPLESLIMEIFVKNSLEVSTSQ